MKRVNVAQCLLYNEHSKRYLWCIIVIERVSLCGGVVEENETLYQAFIREVCEETGLIVKIKDILYVNERIIQERQEDVIFFTFRGEVTGGKISIKYPEEISEIKWADIATADKLMAYYESGIAKLIKNSARYTYQD